MPGALLAAAPLAQETAHESTAGLVGLAQALSSLKKTDAEKHNIEKLEELKKLEESGGLGLNLSERAELQRAAVDPVKQVASEGQRRSEAAAAGLGARSGADIAAIRKGSAQEVGSALSQAGAAIGQANLAKKTAQQQELEQRIQAESQRKLDKKNAFFQSFASIAGGGAEFEAAAGAAGRKRADKDPPTTEEAGQELPPGTEQAFAGLEGEDLENAKASFNAGTIESTHPNVAAALQQQGFSYPGISQGPGLGAPSIDPTLSTTTGDPAALAASSGAVPIGI